MTDVKNANGKLVCRIEEDTKTVEIVHKGYRTQVHFRPDGTAEIINSNDSNAA